MIVRSLIAIVLLALVACAGPVALDVGWIEVSTKNFSIYSTMSESDARSLLEDLELFRAALLSVTRLRDVRPHVPTEIYAFQASRDYRPFRPAPGVVGHFLPGLRANLVGLSAGENGVLARVVLYHEYTHFLLHDEGRGHYPLWFDEGFAEMLSSVDVLGALVRVGTVPQHRMQALMMPRKVAYERVIGAQSFRGWNDYEIAMFYAQSWLLVHHLILGQGGKFTPRLDRYLDRVAQGIDNTKAFEDAFGIDVDELDERLTAYAKEIPSFGLPRRDLLKKLEIKVRSVPTDEIANRLGWFAIATGRLPLAKGYFERAAEENPNRARAIAGLAELNKFDKKWAEAEAGYRRSLELSPDDWQNQLELAEYFAFRAYLEEAGREENLARARERLARVIELAPDHPDAHAVLGTTYTIGDQPPEPGIEPLERAAKLLPAHAEIEFPLAQLHYRAKHRARALELLRLVVYQAHGRAIPDAVKMLEELERDASEAKE
jgi:tetratricopeptide (TPR) repeat protein